MAIYFMSTTGNDSNPGSQVSAWTTFNRAFNQALSPHVVTGDTLYLRGGNYGSQGISSSYHTIPTGTSWANAPNISSYQEEVAVIRWAAFYAAYCKYVILTHLKIDGANSTDPVITGQGANHIRFVNCEVTGGNQAGAVHFTGTGGFHEFLGGSVHHNGIRADYDHGFYIHSPNNLVDFVDIYQNAASGVHLYISSLPPGTNDGNIVRNCRIYENKRIIGAQSPAALICGGGSNILIYNNLIYNNLGAIGIQISYGGVNAAKILHNTLYNNTGPNSIQVGSGALNTVLKNNVVYRCGTYRNDGTGTIQTNNLGLLSSVNPMFVNAP